MERIIYHRWFALADLALVSVCCVIWYLNSYAGWWPLWLCLLPWLIRLVVGRFPIERTVFDLPIIVFLMTAAIGVWATYNHHTGWWKFRVLLGAVFLFYSLAGQPRANLPLVSDLLGILGATLAVSFLFNPAWFSQPSDLAIIDRLAEWWQSIRPDYTFKGLSPNITGGLLAVLLPFCLINGIQSWQEKRYVKALISFVIGGMTIISLFLTSSRGAWIALAAMFAMWFFWRLTQFIAERLGLPGNRIFLVILSIFGLPALVLVLASPGWILGLIDQLPGLPSGTSRFALASNSIRLISDFSFTGGGLSSFSGLYSHYMMINPNFIFNYSHNFYLDVILEQGIFGGLATFGIFLGATWLLISAIFSSGKSSQTRYLREAILASLLVSFLHGLVDDPLYANQGTPLLFLGAGMTWAATRPTRIKNSVKVSIKEPCLKNAQRFELKLSKGLILSAFAIPIFVLSVFYFEQFKSSWYSNLGAIYMARVELADFPSGEWDDGQSVADLAPAEELFHQSISLDSNNLTAQYRLGMIALLRQDFQSAVTHLEIAYRLDPAHRGVHKMLGYTYVWLEKFERAKQLLVVIPEARREMGVYEWWWTKLGRGDLANQAAKMVGQLETSAAPTRENN